MTTKSNETIFKLLYPGAIYREGIDLQVSSTAEGIKKAFADEKVFAFQVVSAQIDKTIAPKNYFGTVQAESDLKDDEHFINLLFNMDTVGSYFAVLTRTGDYYPLRPGDKVYSPDDGTLVFEVLVDSYCNRITPTTPQISS